MVIIIDGKDISAKIRGKAKEKIDELKEKGIVPGLGIVLVGSDESSKLYVELKAKHVRNAGALATIHHLDDDVSNVEVTDLINRLNNDDSVHGILIQLPLPSHLNENFIVSIISPEKDVDGLTPTSLGRIMIGSEAFHPAGAEAVMEILRRTKTPVRGKRIVIGGASKILGRPLASMLTNEGGIVTIISFPDESFINHSREADILIADFKAKWIKGNMVAMDSIIIDAGNYFERKVIGDVDFDDVKNRASIVTPVPGGLGPILIAVLIKNLVKAATEHH